MSGRHACWDTPAPKDEEVNSRLRYSRADSWSPGEDDMWPTSPIKRVHDSETADSAVTSLTTENVSLRDREWNTYIDDSFDASSWNGSGSAAGTDRKTHAWHTKSATPAPLPLGSSPRLNELRDAQKFHHMQPYNSGNMSSGESGAKHHNISKSKGSLQENDEITSDFQGSVRLRHPEQPPPPLAWNWDPIIGEWVPGRAARYRDHYAQSQSGSWMTYERGNNPWEFVSCRGDGPAYETRLSECSPQIVIDEHHEYRPASVNSKWTGGGLYDHEELGTDWCDPSEHQSSGWGTPYNVRNERRKSVESGRTLPRLLSATPLHSHDSLSGASPPWKNRGWGNLTAASLDHEGGNAQTDRAILREEIQYLHQRMDQQEAMYKQMLVAGEKATAATGPSSVLVPAVSSNQNGTDSAIARVEMQMAAMSKDITKIKAYQKFQRMQQDSDRLAHIEAKLSSSSTALRSSKT